MTPKVYMLPTDPKAEAPPRTPGRLIPYSPFSICKRHSVRVWKKPQAGFLQAGGAGWRVECFPSEASELLSFSCQSIPKQKIVLTGGRIMPYSPGGSGLVGVILI